ncbi:MAG: binding domain protein [Subtercola sp.]|nr:binding domain protein [Subtercola sp.]
MSNTAFARAVVIGGSIAGSLAAAAIAPHVDEVIVLDRDTLPEAPELRKNAPQGAHFHALLAAGRQAMDELLPGFSDEAFALGAAKLDATADVMRLDRIGWSPRFKSSLEFLMASRPLIEKALRDRASAIDSVSYRSRAEVAGLVAENGTVTGVRLKGTDGAEGEFIAADLVIEATGRSSKSPDWLRAIGFAPPSELVVNAHWGYSSTFVRTPDNWDPGFQALACVPYGDGAKTPEAATRAMAMWTVEGDRRWILTVQGSAGDMPPRSEDELRAFVSSIGVPQLTDTLDQVEFPERISIWRDTTSRLRDFAAQSERPENFIAIGDAWAAFNPVYGQGMTAAALEARTLARELTAHLAEHPGTLTGLADRFYTATNDVVQFCWRSSTNADYRIPGVEIFIDGVPQNVESAPDEFGDRLAVWMAQDQERYVRYRETTQLLRSSDWLRSDDVVSAVTEHWDELGAAIATR